MNKIIETTEKLIGFDSPTGYTKEVIAYVDELLNDQGLTKFYDKKGNLYCQINDNCTETTVISVHVDTLGFMVKEVVNNQLKIDKIGGINLSTVNGEYCTVRTRDNKLITGVIHSKYASSHVHGADASKELKIDDLVVSLDYKFDENNKIEDLKINTGCYVNVDPKFTVTNDYVKSRFLDDKLCSAMAIELIKEYVNKKSELTQNVIIAFSTYEEVGHGMSSVNVEVDNFIALDMACVGDGLDGNEHKVTVCAKDSSGPYDYELTTQMINLCEDNKLNYAVDIYPYYGSDASAALRGGNDIKACLIGPGVAFSHGVERSHIDGINDTYKLLQAFITKRT